MSIFETSFSLYEEIIHNKKFTNNNLRNSEEIFVLQKWQWEHAFFDKPTKNSLSC